MPVSARRQFATVESSEPDGLRAYTFHGCDLVVSGSQATGDCPFCGKGGKFSVNLDTSKFRCWHGCSDGNAVQFMRQVYDHAFASIKGRGRAFYASVVADRKLIDPATVAAWGIVPGADGAWLVPGYSTDGRLDQVYRRVRVRNSKGEWEWRLLPTPGIWTEGKRHALHLSVTDLDPKCETVYVCEGPWDGMAMWEVARGSRMWPCQVLAVSGCTTWREEWTAFCRGKIVILLYDSDHPREIVAGTGRTSRAGYDGMARVAKRLSGVAKQVRWLKWGPDGYDDNKPNGWDVRDEVTAANTMPQRRKLLEALIDRVEVAPSEWFNPTAPTIINGKHVGSVEAMSCSKWETCEESWQEALRWRDDLRDALATILAVAASTPQAGNQLFLDLVGAPGSAKTVMCQGLLVSGHCIHLENMTKIVSGYKDPDDPKKDCSFLARANGKTWITCEFDTILSSPEYVQLMGKVRRIFDGQTTATYGNLAEDRIYNALRTPWIRAGTHRMMDHDQSQLGDRFIRYIIGDPAGDEKREIARAALRSERAAMVETANGSASSILDPKTRKAHALTGGYVDWLRAHVEEEIGKVNMSTEAEEYCIDLAELSADLRARPNEDKKKLETYDTKEMPSRLTRQNVRLAACLAVVFNKREVDKQVLNIVRKVALDTAFGHSLKIVQWLCAPNPKAENRMFQETGGLLEGTLEGWLQMPVERMKKYLAFLRAMDVLSLRMIRRDNGAWTLTDRVFELYLRVMSE